MAIGVHSRASFHSFQFTEQGLLFVQEPLVQVDRPATEIKKSQGAKELNEFHNLLNKTDVHLDHFDLANLHQVMLAHYESPFDGPAWKQQSKNIQVEFVLKPTARNQLLRACRSEWSQLERIVTNWWAYVLHLVTYSSAF